LGILRKALALADAFFLFILISFSFFTPYNIHIMPTLIEPNELANLNVSAYFKMLNKDLAKLSRVGKNQPFVYFRDFKLAGKKIPLLLFVAPSKEEKWETVLNRISKSNFKKQATGIAHISIKPDSDGNGKDDIHIKIKKCEGINKGHVAEEIKIGWFSKDPDVKVYTAEDNEADETDEEQDNEAKTQIENQPSTQTGKLDDLDDDAVKQAQVNQDFKDYLAKVRDTVTQIGGANEFQAGIKTQLQEFAQAKPSTADEKLEFIEAVKTYDAELDKKMNFLSETIISGNTMLEKHRNFLKAIFKAEKYRTSRAQISEHIANLTRLLQFAAKANDYLDNVLVGKNKATKELGEKSKKLSQDIPEEKAILKAIADLPILSDNPTLQEAQTFSLALFEVVKIIQNAINGIYPTIVQLRNDKSNPTLLKKTIAKSDELEAMQNEQRDKLASVQTQIAALVGNSILQEILTRANISGTTSPESVYDAFMDYFRGKITYHPAQKNAKLLEGANIADCSSICDSLNAALKAADPTWQAATVHIDGGKKHISIAVDNDWLDPDAPGHFSWEGKNHYYFFQHFVVEVAGKRFCPTTGRKGADASSPLIANAQINTANDTFSYKSKNYKIEEKLNGNHTYLLTEL